MKKSVEKMTEEDIKELGEIIFAADNGYGKYTVKEIDSRLYKLGLADKNGVFIVGLTGKKKEVVEKLMDILG